MSNTPRIVVLMATHNGAAFVEEQLNSVLDQIDVDVRVIVSDDNSEDSTLSLIQQRAADDDRVSVLAQGAFGSAAANFYRLIREANVDDADAIAFCDQDDTWEPWKLRRHFDLLTSPAGIDGEGPYNAVSSNVAAVDADGHCQLIVKNQRQRANDYAFESGGPGSTFLLHPKMFEFIREQINDASGPASQVSAHDWCVYALVRAHGERWFIDAEPSVRYRQHEDNVLGANEGLKQHLARLQQIANGSHRHDAQRVLAACIPIASRDERARLEQLYEWTVRTDPVSRIRLARQVRHLRRRRRDQLALAATVLLGLW